MSERMMFMSLNQNQSIELVATQPYKSRAENVSVSQWMSQKPMKLPIRKSTPRTPQIPKFRNGTTAGCIPPAETRL